MLVKSVFTILFLGFVCRTYEEVVEERFLATTERKCLQNGDNTTVEEYKTAVEELSTCQGEALADLQISPEDRKYYVLDMICSTGCLRNFLKKVEPCLHTSENFLPEFILQLCSSSSGSKMFKDEVKYFFKVCPVEMYMVLSIQKSCLPKLKILNQEPTDDSNITKSDVCSDTNILQECILDLVLEGCGKSYDEDTVKKAAAVFLKSGLKWCEKNGA